jgi:replication factor C small subunit
MQKEHYILNEKYRPQHIDGFICDSYLKEKVNGWVKEQNIPILGFFGKPGSGKTTLAKILVKNIDCDYLIINATDKRSMDDIRGEILPFVSTMSFKDAPKIVILDEATHILQASQVLLLNMIETYSASTRFILTGNYPERLIEPLRSRLEDYNLVPPSMKAVAKHLKNILETEQVEFTLDDLAIIVKTFYPDIRRTINNLQKYIEDGKLVLPPKLTGNVEFEKILISELQKPNKNSFLTIRQLIADNDVTDFDTVYTRLFTDAHKFAPGSEGIITIIINEHMFQSAHVLDKEICFMACIQKILDAL